MSADETLNEIRASVGKEDYTVIREGLKFLADKGKFKKNHESIGKELLSKDSLSYDELKLAKQMLKGYEGDLDPKLYLEILNYKPTKPVKEKSSSKAIEGLDGQFFSTPQGLKFYVEAEAVPMEIEGETFEGLIADRKYQSGEGLPTGDEIANIRRLARYWASKNLRDIGVRVSKFEDGFIYDPIKQDSKVYFITKSGYELKTPETPYTVRYTGMLEAPIVEGTIQDLLSLIRLWHLDQKSEILSMGLDFSRFIPDIPHAIENIDGAHGAGKTSYTETKRSIFDPNGAPTQSLKFDERDLSISAVHQGMLSFDNVNTAMPDYISDIICRLTTGQGFRTRELYTNMGEVILKLKRPIIINGINRASYKPDFIDRECPIHLGVMPESRRLTDAEIRAKADMLIPKVRGYLISIIPRAMELYPQVEAELKGRLPRMADFVIWAECGVRAMGFPALSFFDAYSEAKHSETVDVARETLLISAIQALMIKREKWEGTVSDLLEALEPLVTEGQRKSKAFPKDARRLGRIIKELEPTLREIGLEITEDNSDKNERKKVIKKILQEKITKVNVGNVGDNDDTTKSDVQKPTLDPDINFSENSSCRQIEATESDVQSDTDITDIKKPNSPFQKKNIGDLKDEILKLIETEAPKTKYHSLTPKKIFDMIGLKFPDATLSQVYAICEESRNEGILIKPGPGYCLNAEWLNGGGL